MFNLSGKDKAMKTLYGFFSLMVSAGVLAAGELTVGDFTDPSCWRATVDRKWEKAAIITCS